MSQPPAKRRRGEQQLSISQRRTILWLMNNGYGIESVMERFGLSELAAMEYVQCKVQPAEPNWRIRWDDCHGDRKKKLFKTFDAAKVFHSSLRNIEWSKIDRV